jgi:hypothetical protein
MPYLYSKALYVISRTLIGHLKSKKDFQFFTNEELDKPELVESVEVTRLFGLTYL